MNTFRTRYVHSAPSSTRRGTPTARRLRPTNPSLNTLDQVLAFTHTYSAEIRKDPKSRRIYLNFRALTQNQFDALLAFSLWKVRGHSFSIN